MSELFISNYLLLQSTKSEQAKRLKRKLKRKNIANLFTTKIYKDEDFDKETINLLLEFLYSVKKADKITGVGVLTDHNIIKHNVTVLPHPPSQWDVLYLQSDIAQYDFKDDLNNIYWVSTKVFDSQNYVINPKSLDSIVRELKQIKSWSQLFDILNSKYKCFSITQHAFSERIDSSINYPFINNGSIEEKMQIWESRSESKLLSMDKNMLNFDAMVKAIDSKLDTLSKEDNYNILPSISMICPIDNNERFFHLLYTFLKIDYPSDKLELVIVDDNDFEKKIKGLLPNDKRIKIINISQKNKDGDNQRFSLGYKLNTGIKYASHKIIYNFFDTNVYIPTQFKDIIKCFLASKNTQILGASECLTFDKTTEEASVNKLPHISNLLYNKSAWEIQMFDELSNDSNLLLYRFTYNRRKCCGFIPSLRFGFKVGPIVQTSARTLTQKLPLTTLLDKSLVDSFNIAFNYT
jgi:hypothetical protein